MGQRNRDAPPTEWCDWWDGQITMLTPEIGYGWVPRELTAQPDDPNPWFWHWCPNMAGGRWIAQATSDHDLVSRQPLHMEPSLLWSCCGTHGFVRDGRWIGA